MSAKRRFFLTSALGIVLCLLIGGGVYGYRQWRLDSQYEHLVEIGAIAQRDDAGYVTQINYWPAELSTDELKWLQKHSRLRLLNLGNMPIADADIELLKKIPSLEELILNNIPLTDAQLIQLAEFPSLKSVAVSRTAITRVGVHRLKHKRPDLLLTFNKLEINALGRLAALAGHGEVNDRFELTELDLRDTKVQEDDLRLVASCPALRMINLRGTKISDAGLAHLKSLKNLEELWLTDTAITDEGVKHLASLTSLKSLSLARTQITNDGLSYLTDLKKLELLHVGGTRISNDGVPDLSSLRSLRQLHLSKTAVTKPGVDMLIRVKPTLQVFGGNVPAKPIKEIETRVYG